MGFEQLRDNPDARSKINRSILEKYGTWDNWWNSLCRDFGDVLMYRMADMKIEDLAEKLNKGLGQNNLETVFHQAASKRIPDLCPQVVVGHFRIDFGVTRGETKLAIELDGQQYHSTPEQRRADASRERYLERTGWRVIRFTAGEVFDNAGRCVDEVLLMLESLKA